MRLPQAPRGGRARHPEVDDVALDRRADVRRDRGAVARDEDPRPERDHPRVDRDHTHADRKPAGRPARQVVRHRVDDQRARARRGGRRCGRGARRLDPRRRKSGGALPLDAGGGALSGLDPGLDGSETGAGDTRPAPDALYRGPPRGRRALARCKSRTGPTFGVGELAPYLGQMHELGAERARAGAELGCDAAVGVRRALKLVEPGEHRRQRSSAEQDRDRVGIALDIEPAQQVGDPPVGCVERAADDGDAAPGARKPRIECLPPAFEPHGGLARPRDGRFGGVELELRRALRVRERCEPVGRTGCAGRRRSGASQEDDRRARHEVSRTPPHRAGDRTTRI